jgi:transposase-like protein
MEEGFPKTLVEFEERFATEESCAAYLRKQRWPTGFECPRCSGRKSWPVRGGRLEECADCGKQTSVTAGTLFHRTRKPLRLWFRAMAQVLGSKQGCSAKELERLLGLSHETAWLCGHKLRDLMKPSAQPLSGRVEVDESYVGGEDSGPHFGRSLEGSKTVIVAAVEDKGTAMGRARMERIPSAAAGHLLGFVERNVAAGSVVHTDGWKGYARLEKAGYSHHREVIGDPKTATKKFPHTHRLFALAKRVLLATHQGAVSHRHLSSYLDEFIFRFNRRSSGNRYGLVRTLLSRFARPVCTYPSLVARSRVAPPLPIGAT